MLAVLSIVWLYTVAENRTGLVLTDTQAAIDYMYNNGLTKFSTTTSFMADSNLRRDEAAAFFARFARDVLDMVPDTSKAECNTFTDLSLAHSDLKSEIVASCQLGLFKGSNGKFMPTTSFSNAHAITVMVRLLNWEKEEPVDAHRAREYRAWAINLGITEWLQADKYENLDKNISRGEVARLIEAGSVQGKTSIDYSQEGEPFVWGYIEGAFNYPSDYIPSDMTACAEDINTQQVFCSSAHIQWTQYQYWEWFKIQVPTWDYEVYQYSPSINLNYKWYYSAMVACWLVAGCPQNILTVNITNGQTVSNINPRDRYQ